MTENNGHEPESSLGDFLAQLTGAHEQQHDHEKLHAQEFNHSVYHFLDSLNAEQLFTFRRILATERDSAPMNHFDGVAAGCLRWKHDTDPFTGRSFSDDIAQAQASAPDQ